MFGDGALTFQEFMMREPLPLATIHRAVLEFLQGRDDVALYGAQAVNAYVAEPRMTEDVDLLSPRAAEFVQELRDALAARFHIALRVRRVKEERGFRLYQVRRPKNRHLVDVRPVDELPPTQRMARVLVVSPPELIASKVIALEQRRGRPKAGTDWRDLAQLLLAFPELKTDHGPVRDRLDAAGASPAVIARWHSLVAEEILPEDEET